LMGGLGWFRDRARRYASPGIVREGYRHKGLNATQALDIV
jgi:hypothetical protein